MIAEGMKKYLSLSRDLLDFLNKPLSFEEARKIVVQRMEQRGERFLGFVKRAVYNNPGSPYLPLLRKAQCSYGDMAAETHRTGIEGLLRELRRSGVWISFDEFKGAKTAVRGEDHYQFSGSVFDNPLVTSGLNVRTGGSSGRPGRSHVYFDFLAARACYDHLFFNMLGIYGLPVALWYPTLPASTGINNSLRYAKIGHPPERWFNMIPEDAIDKEWKSRLTTSAVVWLSQLSKNRLPHPRSLRLEETDVLLDWIVRMKKESGRCAVQSYVSQAVRVCQTSADRGVDIAGTLFVVGSEPLTEAKSREIEKVNATVFPRYHATEMGSIATGCGQPSQAGDFHLHSDTIALIQDEHGTPADQPGTFYFTSFIDGAPKVMINVELGDTGLIEQRHCGCLFDDLGFHTHLLHVRSASRTSSEGMSLCYHELVRIIEDVLPLRYGGSHLNYQIAEVEDGRSLSKILLRIDPQVGPIDEGSVVNDILMRLSRIDQAHRIHAEMWRQASTLKVVRERPQTTKMGKHVPVVSTAPDVQRECSDLKNAAGHKA